MARRYETAPYVDPAIREMFELAKMYRTAYQWSARIRRLPENYDPHRLDTTALAARTNLQLLLSSFFARELGVTSDALAEEACELVIESGFSISLVRSLLEPLMESAATPVPDLDIGMHRSMAFWGTTSDGVEHYGTPRRRALDIEDYTDECETFEGDLEEEIDRTAGHGLHLSSSARRVVEVDLATGDEMHLNKDGLPQARKHKKLKIAKAAKAAEQKPRPLTLRQKLRGRPDELPDS